jgi:hypothetical protein
VLASLVVRTALVLIAVGAVGSIAQDRLPKGPPVQHRGKGALTIRFVRERVVACQESNAHFYRKIPSCKPSRRPLAGHVTLEMKPLPDAARGIFGPDERRPVTIELQCEDHRVEKVVSLDQGPWLVAWKETSKSIRIDVEKIDKQLTITSVLGSCKNHLWHCRLNPSTVSNRLEILDRAPGS